jgi:hypothetical protein
VVLVELLADEVGEDPLMGDHRNLVVFVPVVIQHPLELVRPMFQLLICLIKHSVVN